MVGSVVNGFVAGGMAGAAGSIAGDSYEVVDAIASKNQDELFETAGRFIIEQEKASIGNLQRHLRIGFNRAARIMDQLYAAGVVSKDEGTKPRKVLMKAEEFEEYLQSR